ncbi:MAG: AI-2E family transporter [Clostridia bacterium]|nr:AI-2E family transporter [Clostridia bacterium]
MSQNDSLKEFRRKGIIAFLVVAASVLFFFAIYRFDIVKLGLSEIFGVLQPIIYGFVIAYLLNPLVDIFNNKVFPKMFKGKPSDKQKKISNVLSVFCSMLIFTVIITGIFVLIIPAVADSVKDLADTVPKKANAFVDWSNGLLTKNKAIKVAAQNVSKYCVEWLQNGKLETYIAKSADYVLFGVIGVVNFIKNFAVGYLISIYVLYNKKRFGNKSRKILCATFNKDKVDRILFVLHKSNSVFSGFIYGKILDSLIIGVLCFIGLLIFNMPYPVLIAAIICITNVIPVFGPYIGGIPCALLIFLTDPIKGVYFSIFIILLQMLDGNLIGPKILGGTTGIETFWVIVAIIVGGGLFGVLGMLLGVPIFAIIYYFASMTFNKMLKKKKMSTDSNDYRAEKFVNSLENEDKPDEEK